MTVLGLIRRERRWTGGWGVYGGEVSKEGVGGEEESRLTGVEPQIPLGEVGGEGGAGEEVLGGVGVGATVGADVVGRLVDAVQPLLKAVTEAGSKLEEGRAPSSGEAGLGLVDGRWGATQHPVDLAGPDGVADRFSVDGLDRWLVVGLF